MPDTGAPSASWLDLRLGDALTVLATVPERSVSCCVTSPPYWGLRDYGNDPLVWGGDPSHTHEWGAEIILSATNNSGKVRWNHERNGRNEVQSIGPRAGWLRTAVGQGAFCGCGAWSGALGLEPTPDLYVEHIVEIFRAVRRVLREDGTLWLNLGDSYAGSGKGPSNGKQSSNAGSLIPGKRNPGQWANGQAPTMWLPIPGGLKPKDLVGVPWRVAFALQADGWYLRSDIIWSKPNPMPESVTDRPTRAHEYVFLLSKSELYYYDAAAIAEPAAYAGPNGNQLSPYGQGFTRRSKDEEMARQRTKGGDRLTGFNDRWDGQGSYPLTRNKRSVWEIPTAPYPEAHFATFPPALVKPCIWAGAPEGGIVLDPFLGSGTTAMIAKELGRRALGIEPNPAYLELAKKRCGQVTLWEAGAQV
jgi:DNA modification methylase